MIAREYKMTARIGGSSEIDKNEKIIMRVRDKNTPVLSVTVLDKNKESLDLTGCKIIFECELSNGHVIRDDGSKFGNLKIVDPKKGQFLYTFIDKTKQSPGIAKQAYFRIHKKCGAKESTPDFKFEIIPDVLEDYCNHKADCFDTQIERLNESFHSLEDDINFNNKQLEDMQAALEVAGLDISDGDSVKKQVEILSNKAHVHDNKAVLDLIEKKPEGEITFNGNELAYSETVDLLKNDFNTHTENKSNPHEVTKEQLNLNNVDNVKQAAKVDFDAHAKNTIIHVTESDKTAWNAKETPTGAQSKVDTHANNSAIHVTAADKTSWSGKAEKSDCLLKTDYISTGTNALKLNKSGTITGNNSTAGGTNNIIVTHNSLSVGLDSETASVDAKVVTSQESLKKFFLSNVTGLAVGNRVWVFVNNTSNTISGRKADTIAELDVDNLAVTLTSGIGSTDKCLCIVSRDTVAGSSQSPRIALGDKCISSGDGSFSGGSYSVSGGKGAMAQGEFAIAVGDAAVAIGRQCTSISCAMSNGNNSSALGAYSRVAGNFCTASATYSYARGNGSTASGSHGFSRGSSCSASGSFSYATGDKSSAIETYSHADGYNCMASGANSRSIGYSCTASGSHSYAKGTNCVASAGSANAIGESCNASGAHAVAQGNSCISASNYAFSYGLSCESRGNYSVALGCKTIVNSGIASAFITGNYGNATDPGSLNLGNGTSDSNRGLAFKVLSNGSVYADSTFNSTGADYGEFFEWLDGNPDDSDRVGYFVTLENEKIRLAKSDDYILGIISATPTVIGDSAELRWKKKYITDSWGRIQYEDIEDEDGNLIHTPKINPNWDSSEEYIPRSERKEWTVVGLMGKLLVRDDGTCEPNEFCSCNDEGVATKSEESQRGFRVLSRIAPGIIKIMVK